MSVSFSNSFSTSKYFFSFKVILLFRCFEVSSKSVFFTKLSVSFMLAKFICANSEAKFSGDDLLKSCIVIYLLLSS